MKLLIDVLLAASLAITCSPALAGHSKHVADARTAEKPSVRHADAAGDSRASNAARQRWLRGFPRLSHPLKGRQPQVWRFDGTAN
jgi:hypothetical protein